MSVAYDEANEVYAVYDVDDATLYEDKDEAMSALYEAASMSEENLFLKEEIADLRKANAILKDKYDVMRNHRDTLHTIMARQNRQLEDIGSALCEDNYS